jgi:hypothetical protein
VHASQLDLQQRLHILIVLSPHCEYQSSRTRSNFGILTPLAQPTPETPSSNNDNTNTNTNTDNNYSDVYDDSNLPYCEPGQDEYDDEEYQTTSNNNGASTVRIELSI